MGFGARVGDRGNQTPACLAPGTGVALPPGYICGEEETGEGVHVRVKVGSHERYVEVRLDVE